jgi:hypothetical protein
MNGKKRQKKKHRKRRLDRRKMKEKALYEGLTISEAIAPKSEIYPEKL